MELDIIASGASAVLQLFVTPTASVAGTNVTKNATLTDTALMTTTTVSVNSSRYCHSNENR